MGAGWQKWWWDSSAAALTQRQREQHLLANPGLAILEDFLAEHGQLDLLGAGERGLLAEMAGYREALESSVQVAVKVLEHIDNSTLGRGYRVTVNYRGLQRTVDQISAPYGVARALRGLASDIERAVESLPSSGLTSPLPPGRSWFSTGIDRDAIREGEAIAFTPPRPMQGLLPRLDAMPPVGQSPDNPLLEPTRPGDPHFVRKAQLDIDAVSREGRRLFREAARAPGKVAAAKKKWGGFGEGRRADASKKKRGKKR